MAREPIDHKEYTMVKEAIPYSDVNARLYFELLRNTGCRAREIRRLIPAYIGQNGPEIWIEIYRGKTRQKEHIYERLWLNITLGQQLLGYVRAHRLGASDLIFPRSHQRFWVIWRDASMTALGRPSRIHDIRNVFATYMFDNGVQPAQVAAMLGHKDIKVTMSHYNQMNAEKRRVIGQNTPV
jgi:integrase